MSGTPSPDAPAPTPPPVLQPSVPPPPGAMPWWVQPPKKRSWAGRILIGTGTLLFILSVLVNVYLVMFLLAQKGDAFDKTVIGEGRADQTVAVYSVEGIIDDEAVHYFDQFCRRLKTDKQVKAVVLRIDSPGGGVSASDEIYVKVKAIRETLKKPVVVSMGAVAASGGYYIAAPADAIYAEPTTITGSIGVLAAWPVLKGLMDKYGVEMVTIRSTQADVWKAAENYWERPEPQVRANMRQMLDEMQAKFESVVKAGRKNLKLTKVAVTRPGQTGGVEKITQTEPFNGKVYLAEEAKRFGLIDNIGYQEDAVKEAARLAGLSKPRIVQYARHRSLRELLGFSDPAAPLDAKTLDKLTSPRVMMLWKLD